MLLQSLQKALVTNNYGLLLQLQYMLHVLNYSGATSHNVGISRLPELRIFVLRPSLGSGPWGSIHGRHKPESTGGCSDNMK